MPLLKSTMGMLDTRIKKDDFIWSLGSLCQIYQLPFNPQLLLQQYPSNHTLSSLLHAGKALTFETNHADIAQAIKSDQSFPFIALVNSQSNKPTSTSSESQPSQVPGKKNNSEEDAKSLALVTHRDNEFLYYFLAGTNDLKKVALVTGSNLFKPHIFSFKRQVETVTDDEADTKKPEFGFRWFIPELLKHKKIWRDVVLASLAIHLMGLATPLFTQVVIDKVIVHQTMNTLVVIGIGLFMFMLFTTVMTWTRQYLVIHTGNRVDAVLGSKVFRHLFELPMRYFEKRSTGTLVARVQGIETIREFISGAAVTLILDFPFLFIFLAIMFYYSWQLTLIVLTILTLITITSLVITPTLRKRLNTQFQLGARNQAFLTEYLSGVETVKSLQMEPQLKQRYGGYLADYLKAGFNTRKLSNTYNVTANSLEQIQVLAILIMGAWIVITTDHFTIGMLVAFQMFASRLSGPVLRMVGLWQEFQQANIAVKRLGDIMNAPAEPYSISPKRAPSVNGNIELADISFRYSHDHPFLYQNLNISIKHGECIAIMGPSGSGKSTLTKLLQGFYQPSEGQIKIDGYNIGHLSANELRSYFGIVMQESELFTGTIYDNLIMANSQATFEQVMQACQMAEVHDVIEKLPQGYQTELGEHGVGLSGGQKQRIAIARALLKRPKILIFDEATSHLDGPTAEHFAHTVNKLKGKVTIIFITHQLPKGLKVDEAVILGKTDSKILNEKSIIS